MAPWARLAIGLMVVGAVILMVGNLRSGVVTLRGGARIDRRDQPILYWTLIAVNLGFAMVLAGLALPVVAAGH